MHHSSQIIRDLSTLKVRDERFSKASKAEYFWGEWQAGWKWKSSLQKTLDRAGKQLLNNLGSLSEERMLEVMEAFGQHDKAMKWIENGLDSQNGNSGQFGTINASLAIAKRDLKKAKDLLAVKEALSQSDLHLKIATRLESQGSSFTPGFNRRDCPLSSWTAFEHYERALTLDQANLEAVIGMDRLMEANQAPEFSLKIWQAYHATNPMDKAAEKMLLKRAHQGYMRFPQTKAISANPDDRKNLKRNLVDRTTGTEAER